jgi:hypothetical protein
MILSLTNRYDDLDTCLDEYREWYIYQQEHIRGLEDCVRFLRLACDGRMFLFHLLRGEIVALRTSYADTTDLDRALNEYTQDYVFNTQTITDTVPLLKFLKKATDDSLHILHLMRDELREAQDKRREESALWLPPSLR